MEPVVQDRIDHGPQVEFQLHQPHPQIPIGIALIEHHLLGVHRPTLDKGTRLEHPADG